jgi:hypothetical protein
MYLLSGPGEKVQDVLEMKGILKLIMFLPGKIAVQKRCQAVDIVLRYLTGDESLVGEIKANAKSDHPIAQMFRASMGSGTAGVEDEEERGRKRQRLIEDLEVDNLRLQNEGLVIMNRIRESEADKAAAEVLRAVEENRRMAAETERIKHENEAAEEKKQQHENTRQIKTTKKLTCDLGMVYTKFLSGVLNSKSFMFHSVRHNKLPLKTQMMSDGGDILSMEQPAFFKYFLEFLDVNDYKEAKQKPREHDFRKVILGGFGGAIGEGKVQGHKCYQIDYDKLRGFFEGGRNGYDCDIGF